MTSGDVYEDRKKYGEKYNKNWSDIYRPSFFVIQILRSKNHIHQTGMQGWSLRT